MTRIRLILFSLLAVLATSAVASASASAACSVEGGDIVLCENKLEVEKAQIDSFKVLATKSILKVAGGPEIECELAKNTGEFDSPDSSTTLTVKKVVITFTKCVVSNAPTKCKVTEPIVAEAEGTTTEAGAEPKIKFTGTKPGTTFAEITIKKIGTEPCILAVSNAKVTGSQTCKLANNEAVEAGDHELKCLQSESALKFAEKEAKFELFEHVELVSDNTWNIVKS